MNLKVSCVSIVSCCVGWLAAGKAQCQITFELEGSTAIVDLVVATPKPELRCTKSLPMSTLLCYSGTKTKIGSTGHAHSLNNSGNVGVCVSPRSLTQS